ncbi:MAG: T9SS type A sorting domain-containing protein [Bacteroidota bacterium]
MKSKNIVLFALLLNASVAADISAQKLPLVYDVENTGAGFPAPPMPPLNALPVINSFPDPFLWADSSSRLLYKSDWMRRRSQIGAQIQHYEIGVKPPRPDSITATYSRSDSMLRIYVTVGSQTLTLTSKITLPSGTGPFPAVIGMNSPSGSIPSTIFTSRNIVRITFTHNQVTAYGNPQNSDPYYRLYPQYNVDNTGQYSAWAWGVSRIIDGLELAKDSLPIDRKHLAVTGCSYAGKMALFAGAFDERIALTIAQESGGGGATLWRYSHSEPAGTVECIDNTDYNWFMNSMKDFSGDNVSRLPVDHHELMAMVAPRALYVSGNPDYTWLSNPSCFAASATCEIIYHALGVTDRFGYSVVGGHAHCAVPSIQIPEIEAFVDKFLLGKDTVNTRGISDTPYSIDFVPWIQWSSQVLLDNPTLSVDEYKSVSEQFGLQQNYPNPFNPTTTIRYTVQKPSHVELNIYNSLGQVIATLIDTFKASGEYSVTWEGKDSFSKHVPSGTYFYKIRTGDFTSAKKMIYVK